MRRLHRGGGHPKGMGLVPRPASAGPRARLLEALRASPGATVAELARLLDVDHSTATYHVTRLAGQGLLVVQRHGGRMHCFPPGQAGTRERALAIARRLPRAEAVLARLPHAAPAPLGAVARDLGMTKTGVYWHLRRLAALGLAVVEGPPRARRYRRVLPGEPLRAWASPASAASNSSALAKRRSGSRASALASIAFSPGGTPGMGDGGGAEATALRAESSSMPARSMWGRPASMR